MKANIVNSRILSKKIVLTAATFIATFVFSMTFNGGVSSAFAFELGYNTCGNKVTSHRLTMVITKIKVIVPYNESNKETYKLQK